MANHLYLLQDISMTDQTFTMSLTFLKRNASSDRLRGTIFNLSLFH